MRARGQSAHLRPLVTLEGAVCMRLGATVEMVSAGNAFKEIFREGDWFFDLFCFVFVFKEQRGEDC